MFVPLHVLPSPSAVDFFDIRTESAAISFFIACQVSRTEDLTAMF